MNGGYMQETKADIVKNAIRRFKHRPKRTIARYILHNYGELFDGDIEVIRSSIRYYTGANGTENREQIKELINHKVEMPRTWRRKSTPYKLEAGLWLILADVHVPFHEPKPIESAIKYAQDQKVDGVLLAGDTEDCASVGFWTSRIKRDFDKEFVAVLDFLDFLSGEFPTQKKKYKRGNHEYRLDRLYQTKTPELIGIPLQAMDDAMGLDSRGYDVIDDNQMVLAGKLPIFHGHEFGRLNLTVNPARGLFLKAKSWAMCAHCHRTSEHPAKNVMGTLLTTWSIGCLCDLSPDYNPFGNDWNWGFALINIEKNGNFEVVNKRILSNGTVV
jgi:predicted phosphodiesterase